MKKLVTVLACIAIGICCYLLFARVNSHSLDDQARTIARLRSELAEANKRREVSEAGRRDADEDNLLLIQSIARAEQSRGDTKANSPGRRINLDMFKERYNKALALIKEGNSKAAIAELLWCYDEGVNLPAAIGVRQTKILSLIADLAKVSPDAKQALLTRLEAARKEMMADASNTQALDDFASINRALKNNTETISIYDSLAVDDPRRKRLAGMVYNSLIELGRLQDAVTGRTYQNMVSSFDLSVSVLPQEEQPSTATTKRRDVIISSAVKDIGVLVAVGQLEEAKKFALKVLKLSNDEATRSTLRLTAEKSGHPGLFENIPKS